MVDSAAVVPVSPIPITHDDPLLAHTLRAFLESYLRADYHAAIERLLDARAIASARADWPAFETFVATLEFQLSSGALITRHVVSRPPAESRS